MDSALSIWFLLFWLAGDSCNLIGSFLADQLPLQKYTAVYYVVADLLMLAMYMYYKLKNKRSSDRALLNALSVLCLLGMTSSLLSIPHWSLEDQMPSGFRGRALLALEEDNGAVQPFKTREIIGFVIGSISSVLYLCSRLPQIYTNFQEVNRGLVVFPVCSGDSGKHHIRRECSAEEPRSRTGRGQLHGSPPALAHRQPRNSLTRPGHICAVYDVQEISTGFCRYR
nr:Zgc:113491 [Danio rerio]